MTRSDKIYAMLFSAILCLVILQPARQNYREKPKDSFPLSYYPMFTTFREADYAVIHPAVADYNQKIYHLPASFIGEGGFNQSRHQITRMVREGKAQILCDQIAEKVINQKIQTETPLKSVAIITSVFNLSDYYQGEKRPIRRMVHAISPLPHPQKLDEASTSDTQ